MGSKIQGQVQGLREQKGGGGGARAGRGLATGRGTLIHLTLLPTSQSQAHLAVRGLGMETTSLLLESDLLCLGR